MKVFKKTIVSVACCALVAPLALAKDIKPKKRTMGYVEPGVTVTGRSVTSIETGLAANYQPAGTLVVSQDGPGRYILDDRSNVFNRKGEVVQGAVKPGTPVLVYFITTDGV